MGCVEEGWIIWYSYKMIGLDSTLTTCREKMTTKWLSMGAGGPRHNNYYEMTGHFFSQKLDFL